MSETIHIRIVIIGYDGEQNHGVQIDVPSPEMGPPRDPPEIFSMMSPDAQRAQCAGYSAKEWIETNMPRYIKPALYNLLMRQMLSETGPQATTP